MCGIAGLYQFKQFPIPASDAEAVVREMVAEMHHRGPDEAGVWSSERVVLGHARLSIVDVATGQQPIGNEDRSCMLVYNGEVYDYQVLRARLQPSHQFATASDSEVIVHLYEDFGDEFVNHINGMYAYGLYDSRDEGLRLGIDPIGIKPLYYFANDSVLLFGSELRVVVTGLRALGMQPEIDDESLSNFLQLGWFPAPTTPVRGVKKLQPGERLSVSRTGLQCRSPTDRYARNTHDDRPLVDQLDSCLQEVVASQLVADVPVGVFLSGGIDSSLLTAIASELQPGIQTFSVGFTGAGAEVSSADESRIASEVAGILGTKHHEILVSSQDLLESIDPTLRAMDEPIADAATVPLRRVAMFAREQVKVCLSGDGGDEVFGGYVHHRLLPYRRAMHSLPRSVRRGIRGLADLAPAAPASGFREKLRKARVVVNLLAEADYLAGPFSGRQRAWLSDQTPYRSVTYQQMSDSTWYFNDVIRGPLAGQLLPKTDRMTMSASLETRVPFLDDRIVSFGRHLPWRYKVAGGETKLLLRRLLERHLPERLTKRSKHGFRVPLSGWFRGELKETIYERLVESCRIPESVISAASVRELVRQHCQGEYEHSVRIWALLTLDSWMDSFASGDSTPTRRCKPERPAAASGRTSFGRCA